MRAWMTRAVILVMMNVPLWAGASFDPGVSLDHKMAAAPENSSGRPPVRTIIQSPQMSSRKATSLVKQRCQGCRILSVSAQAGGGFKVKTLSSEGVVKQFFVDGQSGEVY